MEICDFSNNRRLVLVFYNYNDNIDKLKYVFCF